MKNRRCVRSRSPLSLYSQRPSRSSFRTDQCATFGIETSARPPAFSSPFVRRNGSAGSGRCSKIEEEDAIVSRLTTVQEIIKGAGKDVAVPAAGKSGHRTVGFDAVNRCVFAGQSGIF